MKRQNWILIVVMMFFASLVVSAQTDETAVVTTRSSAPDSSSMQLVEVARGFDRPLYVTHAGDDSGRLFLVTQGGIIHVIQPDGTASEFLNVADLLTAGVFGGGYTERGLLGLAFHPDYQTNGQFFINYTDKSGSTVVARYEVSENPDQADANSGVILLTQSQPFPNHNGGHMAFGPDGYLYIAMGDGGAAGDPLSAGQNTDTLLGKILRIDVNADTYTVPADNPFVSGDAPEVWAYGLRNPWRFSFDRSTGDLYIGDVGQNAWEEINFQVADSVGGENYGWRAFEATHVYDRGVNAPNAVSPIAEYNHDEGCSVTGGYVYRGETIADYVGAYFYGDYCSGRIWYAYRDDAGTWQSGRFHDSNLQISSFGEDETGELYVVHYGGVVYRMEPAR